MEILKHFHKRVFYYAEHAQFYGLIKRWALFSLSFLCALYVEIIFVTWFWIPKVWKLCYYAQMFLYFFSSYFNVKFYDIWTESWWQLIDLHFWNDHDLHIREHITSCKACRINSQCLFKFNFLLCKSRVFYFWFAAHWGIFRVLLYNVFF